MIISACNESFFLALSITQNERLSAVSCARTFSTKNSTMPKNFSSGFKSFPLCKLCVNARSFLSRAMSWPNATRRASSFSLRLCKDKPFSDMSRRAPTSMFPSGPTCFGSKTNRARISDSEIFPGENTLIDTASHAHSENSAPNSSARSLLIRSRSSHARQRCSRLSCVNGN